MCGCTRTGAEAGITIGRFVKVCGAIGVSSSASSVGCTIGPPAARLYAVDPVGVATIRPSALTRVTNSLPIDTDRSIIRDLAAFVMTTSFSAMYSGTDPPTLIVVDRSIMRSSMRPPSRRAASSAGYSSGSVTSVRNPRLPKLTPRIGTFDPVAPMQSAIESSVPSPPSTTTRSTVLAIVALSAAACGGAGCGSSAKVAVSKTGSIPRACSQDAISTRCGVASRRCDLAKMPTRLGALTPAILPFHRFDDGNERRVHRAGDAVPAAQLDDRAVHVIDFGRFALQQILPHRRDVP